ncbi:S-adenosyl-L-methionine-dependent methyltransferase [Bombardia bombarda]|uniref:S-adenosyl-L-methionine-dependent methyltransferase n=1 Tax=Bombardia bombarda TaxID=252184 RepID=A0AA39XK13_9PEZI|nr:S-adenosyl-L-methionine-dependent methyltransferase [Bombardia bombarda]
MASTSALLSSSAAPAVTRLAAADDDAEAYERAHVHGVYEAIAPHFSSTRYKPWPAVAEFLHAQTSGAVGLDVGCGNGKYLGVNPDVFMLGSDRSPALIALARSRTQQQEQESQPEPGASSAKAAPPPPAAAAAATASDVLVADGLSLPFRDRSVDFAVCVAVIHHMSTRPRRQEAIRQLLSCVRAAGNADAGGHVFVMVWALEQGNSRRGWDEGGEQDLLVPWVMKKSQQQQPKKQKQKQHPKKGLLQEGDKSDAPAEASGHTDSSSVFQRYYHLYRKGELEEDVLAAGGAVVTGGYERDNWWVVAANGPPSSSSRPT